MLTFRPRHALVSEDNESDSESTSSTSSSSLSDLDSAEFSQDEEEYFLLDLLLDEGSKAESEIPTPLPPTKTKEYPISAYAQAVTLKALNYLLYQIEKITEISRS